MEPKCWHNKREVCQGTGTADNRKKKFLTLMHKLHTNLDVVPDFYVKGPSASDIIHYAGTETTCCGWPADG